MNSVQLDGQPSGGTSVKLGNWNEELSFEGSTMWVFDD